MSPFWINLIAVSIIVLPLGILAAAYFNRHKIEGDSIHPSWADIKEQEPMSKTDRFIYVLFFAIIISMFVVAFKYRSGD